MLLREALADAYKDKVPVKVGFLSAFIYCGMLCDNYQLAFDVIHHNDIRSAHHSMRAYERKLEILDENNPDYENAIEYLNAYIGELARPAYLDREVTEIYKSYLNPEERIILAEGIRCGRYWCREEMQKDIKMQKMLARVSGCEYEEGRYYS